MKNALKTLGCVAALAGSVVTAQAADMALKAPQLATAWSWTGLYVGTHIGHGASENVWERDVGGVLGGFNPFNGRGVSGGFMSGVQAGYNYQTGRTVLGLEGDISFGHMNGLARCAVGVFFCSTDVDMVATLTGRVGYTFDKFLVYGKGGVAWAHNKREMASGNFTNIFTGSDNRFGWVAGAGVEYAFNSALSAKLEYNYMNFGSDTLTMTDQFGLVSNPSIHQNIHLVKAGINYKLGGVGLPFMSNGAVASDVSLPQWSWTGLYVGVHLGSAIGRQEWKTATGVLGGTIFPGAGNHEGNMIGGQIGYNYQMGSWVAGLELAASIADADGYAKCGLFGGGSFTCHARTDSLGTITARLGRTWGNLLIYSKAGVAWAHDKYDMQTFVLANVFTGSTTRWGYALGSGLEYAFSPNLSAFVEYNYLDFGTKNVLMTDQLGNASNAGIAQHMHTVKVGLNYKLGWGSPILSAYAADPRFVKAPMAVSDWSIEAGERLFVSGGRMQKDLYDPFTTTRLNSRLIYDGMVGYSAETFARFDHRNGIFVKGTFGLGSLNGGKLNDEDYPGFANYSNTISDMRNGRISYGNVDLGYNFIQGPGGKVGAYVGYHVLYERVNGYGCAQIATDGVCAPAIPGNFLGLSETESWRGVALGLNSQLNLTGKTKLEVDAAYLPYVNRAGFDNHWFRADINPQSEPGSGWGAKIEGVLTTAVTERLNVGIGGRYWFYATEKAHTQFPGIAQLSPMKFYAERFGGFVQASYKFGDIAKDPMAANAAYYKAPVVATNWSGFYAGGSLGAGFGQSKWADPYPAPVAGDFADMGGALIGGQIGYNYQMGATVLGLEGSLHWANVQGSNTCFAGFPAAPIAGVNCSSEIKALATLTGRAGYAFGASSLAYVKGGVAWKREQYELNFVGAGGVVSQASSSKAGWTLGAGVEHALTANWSVNLEYKYYDFGSETLAFVTPAAYAAVASESVSQKLHTVTMGLNYKFAPTPVIAKY